MTRAMLPAWVVAQGDRVGTPTRPPTPNPSTPTAASFASAAATAAALLLLPVLPALPPLKSKLIVSWTVRGEMSSCCCS